MKIRVFFGNDLDVANVIAATVRVGCLNSKIDIMPLTVLKYDPPGLLLYDVCIT